jgi:hypothetical protein
MERRFVVFKRVLAGNGKCLGRFVLAWSRRRSSSHAWARFVLSAANARTTASLTDTSSDAAGGSAPEAMANAGVAGEAGAVKLAESEKFEINSVAAGRRPFIFPTPAPPWHPKCGVI